MQITIKTMADGKRGEQRMEQKQNSATLGQETNRSGATYWSRFFFQTTNTMTATTTTSTETTTPTAIAAVFPPSSPPLEPCAEAADTVTPPGIDWMLVPLTVIVEVFTSSAKELAADSDTVSGRTTLATIEPQLYSIERYETCYNVAKEKCQLGFTVWNSANRLFNMVRMAYPVGIEANRTTTPIHLSDKHQQ
jgi:hypothetical protein